MKKAEAIWNQYCSDADWEPYDWVDPYTTECNISLTVDGYEFSGWGIICCGEKEIGDLECKTPEGEIIKIY